MAGMHGSAPRRRRTSFGLVKRRHTGRWNRCLLLIRLRVIARLDSLCLARLRHRSVYNEPLGDQRRLYDERIAQFSGFAPHSKIQGNLIRRRYEERPSVLLGEICFAFKVTSVRRSKRRLREQRTGTFGWSSLVRAFPRIIGFVVGFRWMRLL